MIKNRLIAAGLAAGLLSGCAESQPAPAPTEVHQERIGFAIGDAFFGLTDDELAHRLDIAAKLGNTVRLDIDWAQIQPERNKPLDWAETDRLTQAARKRGLFVLAMVGFAPAWARDPACAQDYGCAPADADEFAAFAGEAAAHLKPHGVTDFEVWNEPNSVAFFAPQADPERYARMLTAAGAAIKHAVPEAKVAAGGLSAHYDDGTNLSPTTFLSRMYNAGAANFDAVAIHPYNSPATPDQPYSWSAFTQIEGAPGITGIPTVHGVMAAHGDGKKEVWLTEYGAPTGGGGHEATPDNQHFNDFDTVPGSYVNEALQAKMIDQFLHYRFKDANVTVRLVHTLYDRRASGATANPEDYFGIYHADGTPKAAVTIFTRR